MQCRWTGKTGWTTFLQHFLASCFLQCAENTLQFVILVLKTLYSLGSALEPPHWLMAVAMTSAADASEWSIVGYKQQRCRICFEKKRSIISLNDWMSSRWRSVTAKETKILLFYSLSMLSLITRSSYVACC